MTDRIPPNPKPSMDRAVANAARRIDIEARARLATPITATSSRDILQLNGTVGRSTLVGDPGRDIL